jgi:hypothetical protein
VLVIAIVPIIGFVCARKHKKKISIKIKPLFKMEKFTFENRGKASSWCVLGTIQQRSDIIKFLLNSCLYFDRIFEFGEKKLTCSSYGNEDLIQIMEFLSSKKNMRLKLYSVLISENSFPKSEEIRDFLSCQQHYKASLFLGVNSLKQYPDLNNLDYLIWFSDTKETNKIWEQFFPDVAKKEFAALLNNHSCFIMDNYNREPKVCYFEYTVPKETIYHALCNDRVMCENLDIC